MKFKILYLVLTLLFHYIYFKIYTFDRNQTSFYILYVFLKSNFHYTLTFGRQTEGFVAKRFKGRNSDANQTTQCKDRRRCECLIRIDFHCALYCASRTN